MTLTRILLAAVFVSLMTTATASDGDGLVSSNDMIFDAWADYEGITLAVAAAVSAPRYTEDYAPSQVLELIRPDGGPVTVGRLVTSCKCLSASIGKREFAQGERALIEVRVVKKPPVADAAYAVIVQLVSPYKAAVQYNYKLPQP